MSGRARILLITADTYSKLIHPGDRSVRTIFGDGAAATVIELSDKDAGFLYPFVYGTDGEGAENLIVPAGGMKIPRRENPEEVVDDSGNTRTENNIYMNGAEIFNFTLRRVPATIKSLLQKSNLDLDEIDLFVFHQANQYMLNHLRRSMGIPAGKFVVSMKNCGNTVSSSIPLLLQNRLEEINKSKSLIAGFGVGLNAMLLELTN